MTGIGGQGVQMASSVLVTAAFAQGLEVQVFGSYGGMMRGGATEATVVIGEEPVEAPPTLDAAWSVVLMHDEYSEHARRCLRPGSILLVNSSIVGTRADEPDVAVVEVPATDLAREVGHPMGESLVMVGAYAAATGIVRPSSLTTAVSSCLPSYRSQHREACERAIAVGADAVEAPVARAWPVGAGR